MGKPIDVKNFVKMPIRLWGGQCCLTISVNVANSQRQCNGVMVSDVGCESGDPLTIPADVDLRQVQQQIPKNICENGFFFFLHNILNK